MPRALADSQANAAPHTLLTGMATLEDVALLRDWEVHQSSGYNQLSAQGLPQEAAPVDEQGNHVLLDITGPGLVTRIWGSGLSGNLKIWIDEDVEPRFTAPWRDLARSWWTYRHAVYQGNEEKPHLLPFVCPLTDESRNTQIMMIPMAFSTRCKIAVDQPPPGNQYCVDYVRTPQPVAPPFDPASYDLNDLGFQDVLRVWRNPGNHFIKKADWRKVSGAGTFMADAPAEQTIFETSGPGRIRLLQVELPRPRALAGRALVLRAYWDGAAEPQLELPLADLCALSMNNAHPNVPAGVEGIGAYSRNRDIFRFYTRFPMPFSEGARLTLSNESHWPIAAVEWQLHWEELTEDAALQQGRLGGFMRRLRHDPEVDAITLLDLHADGHLVGFAMSLWDCDFKPGPFRWYAKGYLDGEADARLQGAPFFDFNWGPRAFWHPGHVAGLAGMTHQEYGAMTGRNRIAFYRYMIHDAVRFRNAVRIDLHRAENSGDFGGADISWLFYTRPGTSRAWPRLHRHDLPWPRTTSSEAIQAEKLAESAEISAGILSVVKDKWGSWQFDDGNILVFAPDNAGDTLTLKVPAPAEGYYELFLRQIGGPAFATYALESRGRRFGTLLHGHASGAGTVVQHDPTSRGVWYFNPEGTPLSFICTPENWQMQLLFALDSLWLKPVSTRTNLIEAEYLEIIQDDQCLAFPEPMGNLFASGQGELYCEPLQAGAALTLSIPSDREENAAHEVILLGYRAEAPTRVNFTWNNDANPRTLELFPPEAPFRRNLILLEPPKNQNSTDGDQHLHLTFQAPTPVWIDFFKYAPHHFFEAEALPYYSDGYPPLIAPASARPGTDNPHNVAVRHRNPADDTPLLIQVPVAEKGIYTVELWLRAERQAGRFRLRYADDKQVVTVDLDESAFRPVSLPPRVLSEDSHSITVSISADTWFLLDALRLVPMQ